METRQIPLFPLSIVVFPGETLKLHIFEPRYKQLIHDCLQDNQTFGIPPYLEGHSLTYGTELKVTDVVKTYQDGNMDIKAKAIGWFEIKEFYKILHGKLYPGGEITSMKWDEEGDIMFNIQLVELIQELYSIMKITNVTIAPPSSFKTFQLSHKVGLNIDQELELLMISDEKDKQSYLINHLQKLIPIVKEAENLRKRAELNGHFQNEIPPKF